MKGLEVEAAGDNSSEATIVELEELLGNEDEFRAFLQAMQSEECTDNTNPGHLDINCNETKKEIPLIDLLSDEEPDDEANNSITKASSLVKNPFYSCGDLEIRRETDSEVKFPVFINFSNATDASDDVSQNQPSSALRDGLGSLDSIEALNCLDTYLSTGRDLVVDENSGFSSSLDGSLPSPGTEAYLLLESNPDTFPLSKDDVSSPTETRALTQAVSSTLSKVSTEVEPEEPAPKPEAVTKDGTSSSLPSASCAQSPPPLPPVPHPAIQPPLPTVPHPAIQPPLPTVPHPAIQPPLPTVPHPAIQPPLPPVPYPAIQPPLPPFPFPSNPPPPSPVPSPTNTPPHSRAVSPDYSFTIPLVLSSFPPAPSPPLPPSISSIPSPPPPPSISSSSSSLSSASLAAPVPFTPPYASVTRSTEKLPDSPEVVVLHSTVAPADVIVNANRVPEDTKNENEIAASTPESSELLESRPLGDKSAHEAGPSPQPERPHWSEPFVSHDEAENRDNNDPQWELFQKLETDEARYRVVREKWRQLDIPDPRRDLTRHNFRRSRSQNCREVGKAGPSRSAGPSRKRTRSVETSDPGEHPSKRRRMLSCTSLFDIKIENLHRELNDDSIKIRQEEQQALHRLSQKQQREQDRVMNMNAPHYVIRREIDNLYYHQEREVDDLRYKFDGKLQQVTKGKMNTINLLKRASSEVLAFHKFYQNLDNSNDDHLNITEEELLQFQETEQMYEMFDKMYPG